ncbi:MAG: NUDIX domain-containing protein [Planctomycetaceae bacterium]
MPAQSPDELFDVVDERDAVVRQATRADVHAQRLLHRAVHIFVFNAGGELLLQKRSALKDEFPLRWTSSASGHLDAGESYDEAARRELGEELGFDAPLEFLAKLPASQETANEFTALYRTHCDAEPRFPPEEIETLEFHTLDAVATLIAERPGDFSPPFCVLFDEYRRNYE